MSQNTPIQWADHTWNPIAGCDIESPGCRECYAMRRVAPRLANNPATPHYAGTVKKTKTGYVWTGKIGIASDKVFRKPLSWRKPGFVFVNSTSDLFHPNAPEYVVDRVMAVAALTPHLYYQILTKRPDRMLEYVIRMDPKRIAKNLSSSTESLWRIAGIDGYEGDPLFQSEFRGDLKLRFGLPAEWPLGNVMLGTSVENHEWADKRRFPMYALAERGWFTFCSYEPALGPVDWSGWEFLKGMISGGESGSRARPSQPDWHRATRDWCHEHDIPFMFKQWGDWLPVGQVLPGYGKVHGATGIRPGRMKLHYGGTREHAPMHAFADHGVDFSSTEDGKLTFRVGAKKAGRMLDGRTHDDFPRKAVS